MEPSKASPLCRTGLRVAFGSASRCRQVYDARTPADVGRALCPLGPYERRITCTLRAPAMRAS